MQKLSLESVAQRLFNSSKAVVRLVDKKTLTTSDLKSLRTAACDAWSSGRWLERFIVQQILKTPQRW